MRRLALAVLAPCLGACSTAAESGGSLFAPGPAVRVGKGSGDVVLVDVDRDGRLDVVARRLLASRIEVLLGDGRGGFAAAAAGVGDLPYQPGAMALGDLDGDGVLDLCVAGRDERNEWVDVLRGDGKGSFHRVAGSPFPSAASATTWKPSVRLADVDEDGRLDAVVSNGRRNTIEVLLGDGRGGLAPGPRVTFEPGRDRTTFHVGDADGDGHLDLVTAESPGPGRGPGVLAVRRGDGKGSFSRAVDASASVPPEPQLAALADLDGDGRLDAVLRHGDSSVVSVMQNDGAGRFSPRPGSPFDVGLEAFDVAVADVDGDGAADLVAATVDGRAAPFLSRVAVLLGDGRAFSPAPGSPYPAGPGAYCLSVGDVDGDGRLDVVSSSFEGDAVTLLLGRGGSASR